MQQLIKTAWRQYQTANNGAVLSGSLQTAFWLALLKGSQEDFLTAMTGPANRPFNCMDAEYLADLYAWFLADSDAQRQRRHGIYYTPQPMAAYIVQRTLGEYLSRQEEAIQQAIQGRDEARATETLRAVQRLKIIDPACGTGIFLVEAFKLLREFYLKFLPLKNASVGVTLDQLYGMDIDPVAVQLARLRLQTLCQSLENQLEISVGTSHIIQADMLDGTAFPEIQHWDLILGNPPYVSEVRKQADQFRDIKAKKSSYYQAKMDLCDAFLAWSLEHLKAGGQLGFVLPEYWMQRSSTRPLREKLISQGHIPELWCFGESRQFEAAPGHHSSILFWQKKTKPDSANAMETRLGDEQAASLSETALKPARLMLDATSGKLAVGDPLEMYLLEKLASFPPLFQPDEIQQGVVLPQGRLKKRDLEKLPESCWGQVAGVFLLMDEEVAALDLNPGEQAWLKPFYLPAGFQAFDGFGKREPDYWLIYGDAENRHKLAQSPEKYPHLKAHLDRFAALNTSAFAPYGLHRPRQSHWFEAGCKLFSPRQVMQPGFAVVPQTAYVNEGFYVLKPAGMTILEAHAITVLLNSTLAWFWFYHQKRKGRRLQIDKDVLLAFPSPKGLRPGGFSALEAALSLNGNQKTDPGSQDCVVNALYGISEEERLLVQAWRRKQENCR